MEISNELRARIFAAYWGSKVKIDYPSSNFPQYTVVDKLFHSKLQNKTESLATHYKWNKLILTPLCDITDDDAIEVAKILIPQCFERRAKGWQISRDFTVTGYPYIKIHHRLIMYSVQIDPRLVNFDLDNMDDRETGAHDMKPTTVIDFLRSKSYDVGYGDIPSLIDAGVAVSK